MAVVKRIMDSDNFFGFDTSQRLEEDEDGLLDDDEYNALNEETFGSNAVGGDWEENHEQLSSLTEAERLRMSVGKDIRNLKERHSDIGLQLEELHSKENFRKTLENLSLGSSLEKKRLYERSVDSSPLIDILKDDISSSPGSSIWSPTLGLDNVKNFGQLINPVTRSSSVSSSLGAQSLFSDKKPYKHLGASDLNLGLKLSSSVKTVSELEEELRHQHAAKQHSIMKHNEFEREPLRHSNLQQKANHMPPNSHHGGRPTNAMNMHQLPHPFMNSHENYRNMHPLLLHPSANLKNLGNIQNSLHMTHPLLNNPPNKIMPPGFMSNMAHMSNRHPFNPQMNQRPPFIRPGVYPGRGGCDGRIINRSHTMDRNYDQNFAYDHMRNNHNEQREVNNSQRGNRVRRDSDAEWDEWHRIRQTDEYAGLMTPREKQWLRNIQSMQLQPANPYQDDYYYVMYNAQQQRKREEEIIVFDDMQLLLHDKGKEGKEYEPPKLENSLGKLQAVSVYAPRKIIDLQVIHLDSSHPTTTLQRDMRKHRHLLMHIEKLYNIQIELDDLERKIRALPDCPTRDSFRSKCRQLVSKLWTDMIIPHESFVQILCIKKGKTLVARLLSWVGMTEAEHIFATVIQNLSLLTKKDVSDKRLSLLWPYADRLFSMFTVSTLTSFAIMMQPQITDKKFPALSSRLGLSMVLSLLVCGEKHYNDLANDEKWQQFVEKVALCLANDGDKNKDISSLPSVTLSASVRLPAHHLAKFSNVEPSIMKLALETLNLYESYLTKSLPSTTSAPSTNPLQTTELKTQTHTQPLGHFSLCSSDSSKTLKPAIEIF